MAFIRQVVFNKRRWHGIYEIEEIQAKGAVVRTISMMGIRRKVNARYEDVRSQYDNLNTEGSNLLSLIKEVNALREDGRWGKYRQANNITYRIRKRCPLCFCCG